MKDECY